MVFPLFALSSIICLFTPSSKTMYDISPTKDIVSLENTDVGPVCGTDGLPRWSHKMECHKAAYEAACKPWAFNSRDEEEVQDRMVFKTLRMLHETYAATSKNQVLDAEKSALLWHL
jgi:hypothetical protein